MGQNPNLIWLSLESTRADHTTIGAYHRNTTPNLDRIAQSSTGVATANCFSQSMWTPAATASILTGSYLSTHRVGMDGKANQPLSEQCATLPALLSESGYRTACFSSNAYIGRPTGLDKGFDEYAWISPHAKRQTLTYAPRSTVKYLTRLRTHAHKLSGDPRDYNASFIISDLIARELKMQRSSNAPFFLYAHLNNPHHPYLPPRKWLASYFDEVEFSPAEAVALCREVYASSDSLKKVVAAGCNLSAAEREALIALYDAEIAYLDACLGNVFEAVRDAEDTILVVSGDHGELFGERGVLGHNLILDDPVTNVPLVIYGINDLTLADDNIVQHIDVTKTLADQAGIQSPQFEGRSLQDGELDWAISERGVAHFDGYRQHNPEFDMSQFYEEPFASVRTNQFRFSESSERQELRRVRDGTEDVAAEHSDVCARLSSLLKQTLPADVDRESRESVELSAQMKTHLEDMGYL